MRTIRLAQIVRSAILDLAPEPPAHDLHAVALHLGRAALVTADALGRWAYHCHLLFHMEAGMFREVAVERTGDATSGGHA